MENTNRVQAIWISSGRRSRGEGGKGLEKDATLANLITPKKRLMLELFQSIIQGKELRDTLVFDGVDVLL